MTAARHLRLVAAWLLALLPLPAATADVTLPGAERIELPNGAILLLVEKDEVPLVSFEVLLAGGAVADSPGRHGTANLVAKLLLRGAGDRDARAFAEAVAAAGGELTTVAGLESVAVSGEFLVRDTGLMVELLADLLRRPALDAAELEKLKAREISLLRAAKDADPGNLMPLYANAFLFGAHPYGNPVAGSETSLAAITHEDVVAYYEDQFGGDRLILALAGDFDTHELRSRLETALGDWRPAGAARPEVPRPAPARGGRVLLIDKPGATQTWFWLGNTGVARDYDARAALDIANTLFGGRFTSMLNTALRVESGLTYGARSELVRPSMPGTVAIRSYTRTDATAEAIDMALDVLGRLHDVAPGGAALDSARTYVLGQYPTSLETGRQVAGMHATIEFYGLGSGWIDDYAEALRALDGAALQSVIDAVYPRREELVFVLLGDAAAIRETAARYGTVTEMPITAPTFRAPADR